MYQLLQNFRTAAEREGVDCDLIDGVKVSLPGGWAHVRASNTESMIRIIVEAEDDTNARRLLDWARDRVRP
jgi:phosphomannomutase